jgi:E3 ubiquitin-protein ligase SHPRH
VRGKVNTKAGGFTVLLPSKLQRKNVKPFLKRIAYPDVRPGKEWSVSSEAWDTRDWIQAAIALDPNQPATRKAFYRSEEQRVFLRSGIEAYWEQQGDGETAIATLSLILSIDCFLDLKKLWDPLPGVGNDLMGLIFHSLLPSPSPSSSMVDSERRADSLRHFYSCLRPAPPVPYSRSLQPNNMPTKLLPFQNRTVAWLLQRERAAVSKNAGNGRDPEGFWSAHDMGSLGNTAYRRLTGELVTLNWEKAVADRKGKARAIEEAEEDRMGIKLSEKSRLPTLLDLSKVEGSMLCEEMGELSISRRIAFS